MPGKKKKKDNTPAKKKKVGGISAKGEDTLMLLGGTLLGALAKRFGDTIVAKQTFITDPAKVKVMKYVIDGVEVVGGAFVAYKMKHPFVKGIGVGFAMEGGIHGLQTMGVLAGVGAVDAGSMSFPDRVNGINDTGKHQLGNPASMVNKRMPQQQVGKMRMFAGGGMS